MLRGVEGRLPAQCSVGTDGISFPKCPRCELPCIFNPGHLQGIPARRLRPLHKGSALGAGREAVLEIVDGDDSWLPSRRVGFDKEPNVLLDPH